ncbi:acyltransferase [Vibrio vulnificus]|uniref:acyltransferase n=2 Tax=Vibrio vulnificus TaxID=672 RepID=UPI0019D47BE3|nr:acyltransferase [Vibrio vulnificus]ELR8747409.1 acyltransferase [Vibrio vulnificus]MBN8034088.1 acyltransferase [Vibrio vulnificus]HAS8556303.1 acyltransferase [Vibrio vulnificus]
MISYSRYRRFKLALYKRLFRVLFSNSFGKYDTSVCIEKPDIIDGEKYIHIESNVFIAKGCWLSAISTLYEDKTPYVHIDQSVYIGRYFHLASINKVEIGKGCMIGDNVLLTDHNHTNPIDSKLRTAPLVSNGPVSIGSETWLGDKVVVISSTIGKGCIIAAGSVVTKDIPDYSIAAGVPAKVIKRIDGQTN